MAHALLAYAYARAGNKAEAQKELAELTQMSHTRYVPTSYFALVAIASGDKDKAFALLQQSFQERSEQILYLRVEPLVDPLRGDPRLSALIRSVGLP
jgi:Flp pilus assembly protein TadD